MFHPGLQHWTKTCSILSGAKLSTGLRSAKSNLADQSLFYFPVSCIDLGQLTLCIS